MWHLLHTGNDPYTEVYGLSYYNHLFSLYYERSETNLKLRVSYHSKDTQLIKEITLAKTPMNMISISDRKHSYLQMNGNQLISFVVNIWSDDDSSISETF